MSYINKKVKVQYIDKGNGSMPAGQREQLKRHNWEVIITRKEERKYYYEFPSGEEVRDGDYITQEEIVGLCAATSVKDLHALY